MNLVLKRIGARVSRSDLVVLALGALGLVGFVSHIAPLGRENALLEQEISANRQNRRPTGPSLPQSPDAQKFLESLPGERQRAEDIAQLSVLARSHGLHISQMAFQEAEHRPPSDSTLRTLNGRIAVEGPYSSIRKWLDEAWGRMPSAEISTLRLSRSADAPGKLRSQLEFAYYSRSSSAGAAPTQALRRQRPGEPPNAGGAIFDPFGLPPINRIRQPAQVKNDAGNEPPMPFTYGGSYRSTDNEVYLMIEGDNVHRIRLGETLPGDQFRLEAADPYRVELIHLPSSRRYTLLTGNLAQ